MNAFNVLTFIQTRTDKNKFIEIKNINTFSILAFIQGPIDNNKFMQIKNRQGLVLICLKSTKSTKVLHCLKSVSKKQLSMYCESMEKSIESKITYLLSRSESDFNFVINSVSDFDSGSDSDFSSAAINLIIFVIFLSDLHPSK